MSPDAKQNGWNEWSRHVLHELERLNDCFEKLREDQQKSDKRTTVLEVKSGLLGVLGGTIPVLIILLAKVL